MKILHAERAWTEAESRRPKIRVDTGAICRYFGVTSDVLPLRRVLTEREGQIMGHDNLAVNDARQSMMVSFDLLLTRP